MRCGALRKSEHSALEGITAATAAVVVVVFNKLFMPLIDLYRVNGAPSLETPDWNRLGSEAKGKTRRYSKAVGRFGKKRQPQSK